MLPGQDKKKKKLVTRLKNKYRLVIMNDSTFEEKGSLRLSPLNIFIFAGTVIISLITFTIYVIAFTDLREYIPGYADTELQRKAIINALKTDSLERELELKDRYIQNISDIVMGRIGEGDTFAPAPPGSRDESNPLLYDTIRSLPVSREDSLLRAMIEAEDQYDIAPSVIGSAESNIRSFFFFSPVKGTVTQAFDMRGRHYGIDVVAAKNEPIKATLDGTVILAGWTSETGYVIGIQHNNNLISIYKHNSALLKKEGSYVKAGEVIAIIGNSGELSTGPHLHFELWYNGRAINPSEYMTF